MPLTQMPNGDMVDIADGTPPAVVAHIKSQYVKPARSASAAATPRPLSAEDQEVQRRLRIRKEHGMEGGDAQRGFMRGMTSNFMDELGAGVSAGIFGTARAIRHGDIGEIGKEYRVERNVQRALDRQAEERSPNASGAGELVGAVMNPLGTGEKLVAGASSALTRVGLRGAGKTAGRVAARLGRAGPITGAVLAGANQGALNSAGSANGLSDVPDAVGRGALVGGATGGALGGALHLGARGAQILTDALPKNASRIAYDRVGDLLEKGGLNPQQAAREIAVTDARGGDAMVQDLTPGLRAQAAAISRRPNVTASDALIKRGEDRIVKRNANFGDNVRNNADMPAGADDIHVRNDDIAARRKASGKEQYEDSGLMDTPILPTPGLQQYLANAPEPVQKAFRGAYESMAMRGEPIAHESVDPNGILTHIPNLRTFDAVKRGFDGQISEALRSGNKVKAGDLQVQLDTLKGHLADANPNNAEYQATLGSMRTEFQKQNALDIGKTVLSKLGTDPRVVLRQIKSLPEHAVEDARVGILDALINSDRKADPVAFFRSLSRTPKQREVLEFAFGGKGEFGRFNRWVNRETRATKADVLTAPGRQSETSRIMLADDEGTEGASSVLSNAMRGYAFGGTIGAASHIVRTLKNIATGTTRITQEEIAKILLSKGEGLAKGVGDAKAYRAARQAGNRTRARIAGKIGQQQPTDTLGGF